MLGMTSKVPVFVIFSWLKFWGGGGQIWQTRIIFEPTCAYARWAHMHRFLRQGLFWSAHRRISAHFPRIPTPLRSVQICSDNGSIYEGVGPLERVKILRNQPKMASFSPANALWEQSLFLSVCLDLTKIQTRQKVARPKVEFKYKLFVQNKPPVLNLLYSYSQILSRHFMTFLGECTLASDTCCLKFAQVKWITCLTICSFLLFSLL